ncbi:hypothetical protein C0Q70_11689 [Pomacea canaliculata]|uniref:Uncharacterized protein n=1 Tax=Pomacea canaliculata TaxID=400727 RepID=A0A2T7P6N3_POMCA|nr:hypothetical protein C0Q70_11689 [Pomacea canaliculata]
MAILLEMLDINTGLALGVAVVSLLWWFSVRRPARAPPGPWLAVPLLGHLLLLMKKDTLEQFAAWRRQYGDVFSLYLGSRLVVVLNGYKVLKEALVNNADVFSDRPPFPLLDIVTHSKGRPKKGFSGYPTRARDGQKRAGGKGPRRDQRVHQGHIREPRSAPGSETLDPSQRVQQHLLHSLWQTVRV